jgi:hypothetical protein
MCDVDQETLSKALAFIEADDWEQLQPLIDQHPALMKHQEVLDYLGWQHFDLLTNAIREKDHAEVQRVAAEHPETLSEYDDSLIDWTALHWAVSESDPDIVRILLAAGADVNQHNAPLAGGTALALAVENEEFEIAGYLLDHGANPNITGWMWNTPVDKVLAGLQHTKFDDGHPRGKFNDQQAGQEMLERMTAAAMKFDPPLYPDGTVPEYWPPTPERPNPARVARKSS